MEPCLEGGGYNAPSHTSYTQPPMQPPLMDAFAFSQTTPSPLQYADSNAFTSHHHAHTPVTENSNFELTVPSSPFQYYPPPHVNPFTRPQLQVQTHSLPRYNCSQGQEAYENPHQFTKQSGPSYPSSDVHTPSTDSSFSRDEPDNHIIAPVPTFPSALQEASDALAVYSQQIQTRADDTFTPSVSLRSELSIAHVSHEQKYAHASSHDIGVIPLPLPSPLVFELKNKDPHSYPWPTDQHDGSPLWHPSSDQNSGSQWNFRSQAEIDRRWQQEQQEKEMASIHFQLFSENYTFPAPASDFQEIPSSSDEVTTTTEYHQESFNHYHGEHYSMDVDQPVPKRTFQSSRRLFKTPITPISPCKSSARPRPDDPRTPSPNKKLKGFSISKKFFPRHGSSPKRSAPRLPISPPFTPFNSESGTSGTQVGAMSHRPRPTLGTYYCEEFPQEHHLNPSFVVKYELEALLGSGAYGFVMTAVHRSSSTEVAVKFILKEKISRWTHDPQLGMVPIEVVVLRKVDHPGIIKFIEFFTDERYCYLVQELHGSPWSNDGCHKAAHSEINTLPGSAFHQVGLPSKASPIASHRGSLPNISQFPDVDRRGSYQLVSPLSPASMISDLSASSGSIPSIHSDRSSPAPNDSLAPRRSLDDSYIHHVSQSLLSPVSLTAKQQLAVPPKPRMARRASHDLFECIEQHTRLPEGQAKFVFAQVVDIVDYLHRQGICHRDIKDENLVIDANFRVKLIDFGSAAIWDTRQPPPYYDTFFGTITFASSEILRHERYRAPHAEIWTLGVLLAFLVTGESPFRDSESTLVGRVTFGVDEKVVRLSRPCEELIRGCLHPDPDQRFTIQDIKNHSWLQGALSRC